MRHGITTTEFTLGSSFTDGIYRVWVRAKNLNGYSVWSSSVDIAGGTVNPDRAIITTPAHLRFFCKC